MARYELEERTVVDVIDTETGNAITTFRGEEREAAQEHADELARQDEEQKAAEAEAEA